MVWCMGSAWFCRWRSHHQPLTICIWPVLPNNRLFLDVTYADSLITSHILHNSFSCLLLMKKCVFMLVYFSTRQWNDQMLNEACRLVLEEIFLPPSALGRKVEYRRTLLVSFLFRFYLEVLHGLNQMVRTGQELHTHISVQAAGKLCFFKD